MPNHVHHIKMMINVANFNYEQYDASLQNILYYLECIFSVIFSVNLGEREQHSDLWWKSAWSTKIGNHYFTQIMESTSIL